MSIVGIYYGHCDAPGCGACVVGNGEILSSAAAVWQRDAERGAVVYVKGRRCIVCSDECEVTLRTNTRGSQ